METEGESMREEEILARELEKVGEEFAEIIMKIPKRGGPPDEPSLYWLHLEIIERYQILLKSCIEAGSTVLEIGCGPFAITTLPLAYRVGNGCLISVDIGRWRCFEDVLQTAGLRERVMPVECDAAQLPFRAESFDTAVSVHAIRSFRNENTIAAIFKEMFRVSSHIFVAASLPIAKNKAQESHLEMYNLREEIFEASSGKKDDIHYFSLDKLVEFVQKAGAASVESAILDSGLPHYLAFIPREIVEKIKDEKRREELLEKWESACEKLKKYGEEHPPIGIIRAEKG